MSNYREDIYVSDIIATLYVATLFITILMIVVTLFLPDKYAYSYQGNITKYVKNYSYIDPGTHEVYKYERYIEYVDTDGKKQTLMTNNPRWKIKESHIEASDYKYLYVQRFVFSEGAWCIFLVIILLLGICIMCPIMIECEPDPERLFDALSERIIDKFSWVNRFFGYND